MGITVTCPTPSNWVGHVKGLMESSFVRLGVLCSNRAPLPVGQKASISYKDSTSFSIFYAFWIETYKGSHPEFRSIL
jgi:hypothetical protein